MLYREDGDGSIMFDSDVSGAPFRVGDRIVFVGSSDARANDTSINHFIHRYRGEVGVVGYLRYFDGGRTRYPNRPKIGVFFAYQHEEFWAEELKEDRDN